MNTIKCPAPGYIVLKPFELKRKVGAWSTATQRGEDAPELGEVLLVGPEIAKMPFDPKFIPKEGDIIAYKKYNHFKFSLGAEDVFLVHFENYLFTLEGEKNV